MGMFLFPVFHGRLWAGSYVFPPVFTPLDPLRPCSCSKRSCNSKNRKYDHFVSDPCGLYGAGLKAFHFAAAAIRSMWIMGRIIFPAQTLRLSCAGVAMMEGDRGETRTRQLRPRESTCPWQHLLSKWERVFCHQSALLSWEFFQMWFITIKGNDNRSSSVLEGEGWNSELNSRTSHIIVDWLDAGFTQSWLLIDL